MMVSIFAYTNDYSSMKKLTLGLALLLLFASIVSSQEITKETTMYWANVQGGTFSTVKKIGGFSAGVSLNAIKGNSIYKMRYFHDERFQLWEPAEVYNEMSLLTGKSYYSKFLQINLSAGLGVTFGEVVAKTTVTEYRDQWYNLRTTTSHEFETFITPSIPLEIEFMVKPLKEIGLGLSLGGNLNFKRPTLRSTVSFIIGKLR